MDAIDSFIVIGTLFVLAFLSWTIPAILYEKLVKKNPKSIWEIFNDI